MFLFLCVFCCGFVDVLVLRGLLFCFEGLVWLGVCDCLLRLVLIVGLWMGEFCY